MKKIMFNDRFGLTEAVLLDQSKSGLTLNEVVNVPYVQRTATPADPADPADTTPNTGNQGNNPNPGSGDDGMS